MTENGPQPITMTDICAYADYVGIDGEIAREDLLHFISLMDNKTLSHRYKKIAQAQKKAANKQKSASGMKRPRRR